ncbi:cell division protein FtsA [Candidatus Saccharibacteria bacterium]|nr:cell division protein FtsA [Candidatus Saccharibacteria bacterium]MCB9834989.1 cell division protein FtsA [Candidatus Nomurabacteria bacterium]
MKQKEKIIVGIDFGSSKVCCVVGLIQEISSMPSVIGLGVSPVSGVRKGVIVDPEETISALSAAIEEAERMSGITISQAVVGVNGSAITSVNTEATVAIVSDDRIIKAEDIDRLHKAAAAMRLNPNQQILDIIPQAYLIDGQGGIIDPLGMNGIKLESSMHVLIAGSPTIRQIDNVLSRLEIRVLDYQPSILASAEAVSNKQQRERGIIVLDFGAETTGLVIYSEGQPVWTRVIPAGSLNISRDLVHALQVNLEIAEKLKLDYKDIVNNPASEIDLANYGLDRRIERQLVIDVVSSRVEEIFGLVAEEIRLARMNTQLAGGAILTGGGAKLYGIEELARECLKLPVKISGPENIVGIVEQVNEPSMSSGIGVMLRGVEIEDYHQGGVNSVIGSLIDKASGLFKSLIR